MVDFLEDHREVKKQILITWQIYQHHQEAPYSLLVIYERWYGLVEIGENVGKNLLQLGDFTLSSGIKSPLKLECDDFIQENLEGLTFLIRQLVGDYSEVVGIPRGGLVLAESLSRYCTPRGQLLIVDDVATTGCSMTKKMWEILNERPSLFEEKYIGGAVVFFRGRLPVWVHAVFPMPGRLWV